MKNKIIGILKDTQLSKIEIYNQLLNYLSQKRGLFAIRNYQNCYTEAKFESIKHEIKKDYEISDMDIYNYAETPEVPENSDVPELSAEEIEAAKQAHALEVANRTNVNPALADFHKQLAENEDAKTGLKLHEEYPFLAEESTPMEIKALVQDKFNAWRNFATNHAALVEGLEENQAQEEIYNLANSALENFQLNADIKKELDFYKEQNKVLGNHPALNNLRIAQEINDLKEAELVEMKIAAQKNASKARVEIDNKGTNESREKRFQDWTLKADLSIKRLETEFKKK